MTDEPIKTEVKRNPDGTFVAGNPPGPGRPKGKTIKEMVREWLESHPDDMQSFIKHFIEKDRQLAWRMLEGNPQQDVVSDGKALPTPILNVLRSNDSNQEGSEPEQAS